MKFYIIKLTNKITSAIYYDQTTCPNFRLGGNGISYSKINPTIWEDIQKYGWENFTKEIIEETDNPNRIKYYIEEIPRKTILKHRVLNVLTGEIYNTVKEAAEANNIKHSILRVGINNKYPKYSNFKYVN